MVNVVIKITCAGAAQTNAVEIANHHELSPKSCVSAPMPIYVPASTSANTDVAAVFRPAKKATEEDEKATGADMAGIHVSHSVRRSATGDNGMS